MESVSEFDSNLKPYSGTMEVKAHDGRIINVGVCLCFHISVPCRAGETKQNLPLHHPPRAHPAILHHAEIAVGLAVLAALFATQKHRQHASSQIRCATVKGVGRHYNTFL